MASISLREIHKIYPGDVLPGILTTICGSSVEAPATICSMVY